MDEPSALEKIAGSEVTKGTFALIAGVSGVPVGALLPVLGDSLASRRHQERVVSEFKRIQEVLEGHSEKIRDLTDHQYKLINETLLTILQNTEDEKSEFLRNAVTAGLDIKELSATESAQASRAIRDLTAGELNFLARYVGHALLIGPVNSDDNDDAIQIDRSSSDMVYMSGLIGLGLVIPAGSTMDDAGRYVFSPICHKLQMLVLGDS